MAYSELMTSRSPPNRSSPRQPSPPRFFLRSDHSRNFGSMNIDDMFNICSDSDPLTLETSGVLGNGSGGGETAAVTLEDFLAKAGVVNEGDLRVPPSAVVSLPTDGFGTAMRAAAVPVTQLSPAVGGGRGGKRRAVVEELPATQQKQRRMIKNRESAARSRERKQAYTVELESLVTQLEEDNARLLKEELSCVESSW